MHALRQDLPVSNGKSANMFLVLLRYVKPLAEIDRLMPAHVRFLEDGYASGHFLASGRRVPREGGVILAVGPTRAVIETLMEGDPFVRASAATYEIIEFRTSLHHPALAPFADPKTRVVRRTGGPSD